MAPTLTTTRLSTTPDLLGESPIWDGATGRVYWVDGVGRCIRWLHVASGDAGSLATPLVVGCIGLAGPGRLVSGLADGLYAVDLTTAMFAPLYRPTPRDETIRFNDGKVDRQGRFLCGSMGIKAEPNGALVRLDTSGSHAVLVRDVRISNALCFSPDGKTLYFADSLDRTIRAYHYHSEELPFSAPLILVDTQPWNSGPDGATVDADGCLWVALVHAGKIARFTPSGTLDRLIDAPTDMPSCVAFGGPDLKTLFVTSIRDSGTGRAVSRHPDGGHLFAIEGLGAQGLHEPHFAMGAEHV